ncbi:hypothetical protein [Nonomuraea aridisoli]|uniref:hypothetical protein n=1 Tax=Nonomuraea aridisoli TaxID=2070368 RepID=UPI001C65302A|nr:hypothetical protein [Nonomuraea aridisoli]
MTRDGTMSGPGAGPDGGRHEARARGGSVREIGCDLSSPADVRAAAATVRDLLAAGAVRPLRALVANAGTMSGDTRRASPDGYELTFAVNYLAHAQLIGDLLGSFTAPARVVLLGSNAYHANVWRKLTPSWRSCTTPMSCSVAPAPGSTCRCSNPAGCPAPRWAVACPRRFRR